MATAASEPASAPSPVPVGEWTRIRAGSREVEVYTVGEGTPVLFLHGWGLSPRSYRRALGLLAAQGYRVVAPTLPGFGRSTPLATRRQNVAGVAHHVAALLPGLGLEAPVHMIGHSFGGGVAMRLGAAYPDLVASLTLVCPVGGAGTGVVPLAKMATGILHESRSRWVGLALGETAVALTHHPAAVLATALSAWRSDQVRDLYDLREHHIPTRFLFADRDSIVTPGAIPEYVFEEITCEVVEGQHSWLISDPARFAALAANHLSRLTGP